MPRAKLTILLLTLSRLLVPWGHDRRNSVFGLHPLFGARGRIVSPANLSSMVDYNRVAIPTAVKTVYSSCTDWLYYCTTDYGRDP